MCRQYVVSAVFKMDQSYRDLSTLYLSMFRVYGKSSNIRRPHCFVVSPFYFMSHCKLFSEVSPNAFSDFLWVLYWFSRFSIWNLRLWSPIYTGSVSGIAFSCLPWFQCPLEQKSVPHGLVYILLAPCSQQLLMTTIGLIKTLQFNLSITMTSYFKAEFFSLWPAWHRSANALSSTVFPQWKLADFHLDTRSSSRHMCRYFPKVIDVTAIHMLDRRDYKARVCL